eukprot:807098-Rhodomonas_salina.6
MRSCRAPILERQLEREGRTEPGQHERVVDVSRNTTPEGVKARSKHGKTSRKRGVFAPRG